MKKLPPASPVDSPRTRSRGPVIHSKRYDILDNLPEEGDNTAYVEIRRQRDAAKQEFKKRRHYALNHIASRWQLQNISRRGYMFMILNIMDAACVVVVALLNIFGVSEKSLHLPYSFLLSENPAPLQRIFLVHDVTMLIYAFFLLYLGISAIVGGNAYRLWSYIVVRVSLFVRLLCVFFTAYDFSMPVLMYPYALVLTLSLLSLVAELVVIRRLYPTIVSAMYTMVLHMELQWTYATSLLFDEVQLLDTALTCVIIPVWVLVYDLAWFPDMVAFISLNMFTMFFKILGPCHRTTQEERPVCMFIFFVCAGAFFVQCFERLLASFVLPWRWSRELNPHLLLPPLAEVYTHTVIGISTLQVLVVRSVLLVFLAQTWSTFGLGRKDLVFAAKGRVKVYLSRQARAQLQRFHLSV